MTGIKPEFLILVTLQSSGSRKNISKDTSAGSQALPSSLPTAPGESPFPGGKGGWDELIWACLPLIAVGLFVSIRFPPSDPLLQLQSPGIAGLTDSPWEMEYPGQARANSWLGSVCASPERTNPQSLVGDSSQTLLLQAGARDDSR